MKTKYLLAAMALPLFAACTQDEFMGQENESAASALQNRIKVGKVTLTGGEADTRINWETKDGKKVTYWGCSLWTRPSMTIRLLWKRKITPTRHSSWIRRIGIGCILSAITTTPTSRLSSMQLILPGRTTMQW